MFQGLDLILDKISLRVQIHTRTKMKTGEVSREPFILTLFSCATYEVIYEHHSLITVAK